MEITIIFRIALVGILVTILNQILKQSGREEQAFLVSLAGLMLVLFWVIPYISELFQTVEDLFTF
ncbi:MAG: stage III sporulation protein AC [Eubacterium sp.]|jgi:stage III sporulation protein AC|nr:stage III sporulation protein AC [Eubacterium sp.]